MCGNRLNAWKTMPIAAPDAVDVDALGGDLLALDDDPPGVDRLEQVDAAQQRRLAGPGRADEADDLVLGDVEVDAAQDLERRRTTCGAPRSRSAVGGHRARAVRRPCAGRGRRASR